MIANWPRRQLGKKLTELRTRAKLNQREAADLAGKWQASKVSRIEGAAQAATDQDVIDLARLYGATDEELQQMRSWVQEGRAASWWDEYAGFLPEPYYNLIGYESVASLMRCIQPIVFPGLLQSQDYAACLIQDSPSNFDEDKMEALVEVRTKRKRRLYDPYPLEIDAVVAESCLYWGFGGSDVLHGQLRYVRELCQLPTVTVRVVPYSSAIIMLPLELYEFEEEDMPSVAFSETLWENVTHTGSTQIRRAQRMLDRVASRALPPEESAEMIDRRISETKP
jgi:transcriptional regulator with XRE-family HTH domain